MILKSIALNIKTLPPVSVRFYGFVDSDEQQVYCALVQDTRGVIVEDVKSYSPDRLREKLLFRHGIDLPVDVGISTNPLDI